MDAWVRSLMEHGDTRAAVCLGDECRINGLPDEAGEWYRKAAAAGETVAMLRLAMLSRSIGDRDAHRHWLERAAGAGDLEAAYRWAALRESEAAPEDALSWYRKAAEGGDWRAEQALARLASDSGADAHHSVALVPRAGGTWELGTVVTTVVVTLVLSEFVKTLVAKLAEDTYLGVRAWLKGLAHSAADERDGGGESVLLLLEDTDPQRPLEINLWLDAPVDALRSLTPERLRDLDRSGRRLRLRRARKRRVYWHQQHGSWRSFEER